MMWITVRTDNRPLVSGVIAATRQSGNDERGATVKKTWLVTTSAALLVGGVIAAAPALARINDSGPTSTHSSAALGEKPVAVDRVSWAGSKRFMQVQSGKVRGGAVTLTVRPAKKVILGESFETRPLPGPYTEVTLVRNARILMLDGESGTPETFVATLGKRTAQQRGEAFDITFDTHGKAALVEWLYVP